MTPDELVNFAEGLARIAGSGGGARALATHLADATGTGVLVEDANWRHLAVAGDATPASVRDLIDAGLENRLPRALRNGRAGRAMPIYAGDAHVGWLSIFPPQSRAQDLDGLAHALRLVASVIGVELARESGGSRRRTFWERLASGGYHDAVAARDDAAARGIVLAPQYVAIALEPEVSDETRGAVERAEIRTLATEALSGGEADVGVLERGAIVLFLVPVQREIDASNARTAATLLPHSLAKRGDAIKLFGGIGLPAQVPSVAQSVEQAEAALAIGRRMFGAGNVTAYDALGAYAILQTGAGAETLRDFARKVLSPLRVYDEKHQTELERTLRVYFEHGQNVKIASEKLSVHRHTVFYRLRQINEICGRSLDSPHDQLTFRMALAIDALNA